MRFGEWFKENFSSWYNWIWERDEKPSLYLKKEKHGRNGSVQTIKIDEKDIQDATTKIGMAALQTKIETKLTPQQIRQLEDEAIAAQRKRENADHKYYLLRRVHTVDGLVKIGSCNGLDELIDLNFAYNKLTEKTDKKNIVLYVQDEKRKDHYDGKPIQDLLK